MPLDEVKAGMIGIGHTVFHGTELQEFKVHILGVLREHHQGPQRNLILARLEGGPLADTGVIAGHERQPGLHRRPADRRGLVFDRRVSEGADRRHHADRGDDRRDRADVARAPARAGARRAPGDAEKLTAAFRARPTPGIAPFADRPADVAVVGLPVGRRRDQIGATAAADRHAARDERLRTGDVATSSASTSADRDSCRCVGAARRPAPATADQRAAAAGRRRRRLARRRRLSRWARPARSRTSTATASTRSAIRSSTSGRPSSR